MAEKKHVTKQQDESKSIVLTKEKQTELVTDFKNEVVEGIKEAAKTATELKSFEEFDINVDLKKGGKYPYAMAFVGSGEQKVHIEVEMPDGVVRKHAVDLFPRAVDTFGVELKKYGMKKYAISGFYMIPGKRVISCTAKKMFALYI